jgi:hypothetical protein
MLSVPGENLLKEMGADERWGRIKDKTPKMYIFT